MKKSMMKAGKMGSKGSKSTVKMKPVEKASIPQVVAENKYGKPSQRQKM